MKIKDILLLVILSVGLGILFYNDYKISEEMKVLEEAKTIVINEAAAAELPKESYMIPTPKEQVEAVIQEYYKKITVTTKKTSKSSPTLKIKQKNMKSHNIDIKSQEVIDEIAVYIKKKEGFKAHAYKDNTQYSIGYGTRANSKTETITMKEANIRLYKHIKKVILPSFNGVKFQSIKQVHAAIDFAYNLGQNRFKKNIVSESGHIDCTKMMAYNKMRDKDGNLVYNEGLAQRRFENFLACASYEVIEE